MGKVWHDIILFMNQKESYSTLRMIKDIGEFTRPFRGRLIFASILRIIGEVAILYPAYALAAITTFFATYEVGQPLDGFWTIMIIFGATILLHSFATTYANFLGYPLAEKAYVSTQVKTLRHLFFIDMNWHEKENTGSKVKRIERGSDAVNHLVRMWLGNFIEIGVAIVGVLIVIAKFDKTIASLTLLFLVVYFALSVFYTRSAVGAKRKENLKDEEYSGLIFEAVNNIRTVKVMSMTETVVNKLSVLGSEFAELIKKRIFWYQTGTAAKTVTAQIFRIAIMCYIGWGIFNGQYEVGFLVLFYGYFFTIQAAVTKLADTSQEFSLWKQDLKRLVQILDVKPVTDSEEGKVKMPTDWKEIVLKDVSFAYGDTKVLDNVSFTITRGEKIGVVGLSGAGKSTLFKLLLKERENYTGDILVDGVPLRTISKLDYFKQAAVVLQDTEVFNFSLKQNISISNADTEHDQKLLEKAMTVAHVTEFAQKLPDGINTLIGEKGIKLSGGEKQRVGVARAIFKDPELLLLDEATSHLDVESEEKIQDSLHTFFQSVTAVVIAHRLTTIKEMDKILVMEDGKVIEEGNFKSLHKQKGRFWELWEKQKI